MKDPVISELLLSPYIDRKGRRLWSGSGISYVSDFIIAENVMGWLWQRINRVEGTLVVGKDGGRLIIEPAAPSNIYPYPLLFSGTAREIVQQLMPYLRMMEGE